MKKFYAADLESAKTTKIGEDFNKVSFFLKSHDSFTSRAGNRVVKVVLADRTGVCVGYYHGAQDITEFIGSPVLVTGTFGLMNGQISMEITNISKGELNEDLMCGIGKADFSRLANALNAHIGELCEPYKSLVKSVITNALFMRLAEAPLTPCKGYSYNGGCLIHLLANLDVAKALAGTIGGYENHRYQNFQVNLDMVVVALIFETIMQAEIYTPMPDCHKTEDAVLVGNAEAFCHLQASIKKSKLSESEQKQLLHILKLVGDRKAEVPATKEALLFKGVSDLTYNLDKWDCYANELMMQGKTTGIVKGRYVVVNGVMAGKEGE